MTQSLRKRLLLAVSTAVLIVFALLALVIHSAIARTTGAVLDHRLARQAQVILAYAEHEFAETGAVVPEPVSSPGGTYQPEVMYQILKLDGALVYRSQSAPSLPMVPLQRVGMSNVLLNGSLWRVSSLESELIPIGIEIAEPLAERQLLTARIQNAVAVPAALALPLLGLLVWWLTTAALRRISDLERHIAGRAASCTAALNLDGMPTEIVRLGRALNTLIFRQAEALDREHRFTADAAHELRTPLAAIRAQAQVASRATDSDERAHALQQLMIGVDRSGRLINQLLALARLEPESAAGLERRALSRVLKDVIHDLQSDMGKNVRMSVISHSHEQVAVEPVYLMLRNLIDNAVHHSPEGGTVEIEVTEAHGRLRISVRDRGPGIPAELRHWVLGRFSRFSKSYNGTGLGLSIVQRAVQLLEGTLSLHDALPGPGLNAVVEFPLRPGGSSSVRALNDVTANAPELV